MQLDYFIYNYYYPSIEGLALTTQAGYKSSIKIYILPYFGNREMEIIKVIDIEKWLHSIPKLGAAQKAYKTLRQILRKAQDYEMYEGNDPTKKKIKIPHKTGYEPYVLTKEQVNKLIKGFYNHYLEPTVLCAVTMGLRRGEAFGLMWEDINLETGEVSINKSCQYVSGKILMLPTKTEKSTRICLLPRFALQRLNEIYNGQWGRITGSEDSNPEKMAYDYKKWCYDNHLPYTSFTNLRHTWATIAIESGADISIVANMMGHTDIHTCYDYYLKPKPVTYQHTQEEVEKLMLQIN